MAWVVICDFESLRTSMPCMTDARLVVMGKRELVSSAETSRVQGKGYDWSQECGRGR